MQRRLVLEFTKMNGAGNDFVVLDNRFYFFTDDELAAMARRLCRRHTGIGADGLLALALPEDEAHHFRMRYVNADGSFGTMCGNGARCLARFARHAGIGGEPLLFESDAGLCRASVPDVGEDAAPVRLFLQPPQHFKPDHEIKSEEARRSGPVHYLWTGTEHAVCFVPDVRQTSVERLGPALRHDAALAPTGANADFAEVVQPGDRDGTRARLRVRTFEKGVEAETEACGTGAVAAAVAARLLGHTAADVTDVQMPGGLLTVGFRLEGDDVRDVYLEGPAEVVFRGTVEL